MSELKSWDLTPGEQRLLFDPRRSKSEKEKYQQGFQIFLKRFRESLPELGATTSLLGLMTSGTTAKSKDDFKIVFLTTESILASAQAVNQWISATPQDRWLLNLPTYHVGGIGILARAYLSQSQVFRRDGEQSGSQVGGQSRAWSVGNFFRALNEYEVTLTSLVPTQVFDLVQAKLSAPANLRSVFVGGGDLSEVLYQQARSLGWPLMLTYGMTEMSSQVACSPLVAEPDLYKKPPLILLPHVNAELNEDGRLKLNSRAQLLGTCHFEGGEFQTRVVGRDEWWVTEDFAELSIESPRRILPLGRGSDFIKIRGENVNLRVLRDRFYSLARALFGLEVGAALEAHSYLLAMPNARDNATVVFAYESQWESLASNEKDRVTKAAVTSIQKIVEEFNRSVLPFERVQERRGLLSIPRNQLGKVQLEELKALILKKEETNES